MHLTIIIIYYKTYFLLLIDYGHNQIVVLSKIDENNLMKIQLLQSMALLSLQNIKKL